MDWKQYKMDIKANAPYFNSAQSITRPDHTMLGFFTGNNVKRDAAARATKLSAHQADVNRKFQYDMSNSAVQRRSLDMQKAGINPILAAGSPASAPSGNSPNASAPNGLKGLADVIGSITGLVKSAAKLI